jgi:hypothetical protein
VLHVGRHYTLLSQTKMVSIELEIPKLLSSPTSALIYGLTVTETLLQPFGSNEAFLMLRVGMWDVVDQSQL